jgi:hypothetical protein
LSAIVGGWWQCAKLKGGFGLTFVLLKINNTVGSTKNHSGLARPIFARLQNGATENDLWAALLDATPRRFQLVQTLRELHFECPCSASLRSSSSVV